MQFGLLYACDEKRDIQEYQREFCILAVVFSVYILLANIVSIGMFFAHYGVFGQYSFNETIIGFVWGRLWGVYSDPNNGSVLCVASVVLSICAWAALKPKSNRGLKALLAVNDFKIHLLYSFLICAWQPSRLLQHYFEIHTFPVP